MALKDLVASTSALTEETVEAIVGNFVRYDTDETELVLLPEFSALSNSHKILVFLSALHGWRFIVENDTSVSMKPSELEEKTGIPGGSLRPALRSLTQQRLLADKAGAYLVKPASLGSVRKEIEGRESSAKAVKARRAPKGAKPGKAPSATPAPEPKAEKKPAKKASGSSHQAKFDSLFEEGFFKSARTLKDLETRFHEEAVIIRTTSIPKLLLRGVTAGKLKRTKAEINGRQLWVYSNKTAASK